MYLKDDWLKMIGKTVLMTVAAFAVVCIFILGLLTFTAPVAMSRFTRRMGLYGQSAWYSSLQYTYSGELVYLYDAMNISVSGGKDKNVIRYGEQLVQADGFEAYCTASDEAETPVEGRYQYVYGRLSVAYYNLGEGDKSLELAFSVNEATFTRYNAVSDLVYQVEYIDGDKEFAGKILEKLKDEAYAEGIEDDTCLNEMILQLSKFIA
jgi:hypothetical protein